MKVPFPVAQLQNLHDLIPFTNKSFYGISLVLAISEDLPVRGPQVQAAHKCITN